MHLRELLNVDQFQEIQDNLAAVTHCAILLVDFSGKPLTRHSRSQPFCQAVRNNPNLGKLCEKCDARGGIDAIANGSYSIYRCHFGLVDFAIPVIAQNNYVGAILAGQVKIPANEPLETIINLDEHTVHDAFVKAHQVEFDQVPELELAELREIAHMLTNILAFSVEPKTVTPAGKPIRKTAASVNETFDLVLTNMEEPVAHYPQLQPAFSQIFRYKSTHFTLEELANFCNLSQSYLSRLLKTELAESFSTYYMRLRINWSKELLLATDESVTTISHYLGYSEPSYFIKQFKKFEGQTPLEFRNS